MAVEVQLTMSSANFLFGQVFETVPSAYLELDRVVPVGDPDAVIPFIWIRTESDPTIVTEILEEVTGVSDVEVVHSTGDEHLVRLRWTAPDNGLLEGIQQTGGSLLSGYAEGDQWSLALRFTDHDDLSAFNTYCADNEIRFDVTRVTGFGGSPIHECVMTPEQRSALELAIEEGYYKVPREVSLNDLADDLGVSHQACSERLRRAIDTLARAYFDATPEPVDE